MHARVVWFGARDEEGRDPIRSAAAGTGGGRDVLWEWAAFPLVHEGRPPPDDRQDGQLESAGPFFPVRAYSQSPSVDRPRGRATQAAPAQ